MISERGFMDMASDHVDVMLWDEDIENGDSLDIEVMAQGRRAWSWLSWWLLTILGLCTAVLLIGVGVWIGQANLGVHSSVSSTTSTTTRQTQSSPLDARIMIDVKGDVRHPGVYRLPTAARVLDAVHAAGGYLHPVDETLVNEAAPLDDGMEVVISSPPTVVTAPSASVPIGTRNISPTKPTQNAASHPGGGSIQTSRSTTTGRLDLNTASVATLETIPGIGSKRANAIVAYRTQHGAFHTVDELKNIRGIGPALFQKLTLYVWVR